jgi:hypothetical protein
MQAISEVSGLDDEEIRRTIFAYGRPVVLRGLVASWPAVTRARESTQSIVNYLRSLDSGGLVDALLSPPEAGGRMFYSPSMEGFNFMRNRVTLSSILEQVLRYAAFQRPPAVAAQSALVRDCLPGFGEENPLSVLGGTVLPRIWLGNAVTTPTHLDEWCNIACVVCGRRRFTLFPPEQVGNLYVGPLDFAPTGAPLSLVDVRDPDLARFPKFRDAMAGMQRAELEPGDAIYIPPLWWHHVESLATLNVLINYWWPAMERTSTMTDSAFGALLHGILSIRDLPVATREAWRALFEHYVFGQLEDVNAHIPAVRRGMLAPLTSASASTLRAHLRSLIDRADP